LGPYTIPPGEMLTKYKHTPDWVLESNEPLALRSFIVNIKDTENNDLNQDRLYLHHFLILTSDRSLSCPNHRCEAISSGADLARVEIPSPYAYKIDPQDTWTMDLEALNPSTEKNITFQLEFTMSLDSWSDDFIEVEGYINQVVGCQPNHTDSYDVLQNLDAESHYYSYTFPSAFSGTIVYMSAHMHGGGKSVQLNRKATGEVLYLGYVHYDDANNTQFITSTDISYEQSSISLLEELEIISIYDCSQNYYDVMGTIMAFFTVSDYYQGPKLDMTFDSGYIYPLDTEENKSILHEST